MRCRALRLLLTVVVFGMLLSIAGCGAPKAGFLRLSGTADDALVTINDRYVGKLTRLSKGPMKLPVGTYRITIEQVGFFPFDVLVVIVEDERKTVAVELVEIPD